MEYINRDYFKIERIDGITLMSPRPSLNHMKIEFYLANELGTYLKDSVCNVLNETSLYLTNKVIDTRNNDELLDFLRNTDNEVVPDLMVYCSKSNECRRGIVGIPKLIIEILSSNRDDDLITKFKLYQRYGVSEYWIVDPLNKVTNVYNIDISTKKYVLSGKYNFSDTIKSVVFSNLDISLKDLDLLD